MTAVRMYSDQPGNVVYFVVCTPVLRLPAWLKKSSWRCPWTVYCMAVRLLPETWNSRGIEWGRVDHSGILPAFPRAGILWSTFASCRCSFCWYSGILAGNRPVSGRLFHPDCATATTTEIRVLNQLQQPHGNLLPLPTVSMLTPRGPLPPGIKKENPGYESSYWSPVNEKSLNQIK